MREIAPSTGLRKWFAHDPSKWEEFSVRYEKELAENREMVDILEHKSRETTVIWCMSHMMSGTTVLLCSNASSKRTLRVHRMEENQVRAPLTAALFEVNLS
jgi:hypothetical protein